MTLVLGILLGSVLGAAGGFLWAWRRQPDLDKIRFGSPDQWLAFGQRNPEFMRRMEDLRTAFNVTFNRSGTSAESVDTFVFMAGHLAIDDFMEILLLCGNAEAFAAEKVLRALFERVVTLKYLQAHPDEFDKYLDYYWITQRKLIGAIETTFKPGLVDQATVDEVEANYQKVKSVYQITLCKECGTTRPGISWTPKDVITMAKEVGLTDYVVPCYYMPMQQAHPTVKGMLQRLKLADDGRLMPDERLKPLHSDRVLCAAHALVLHVLDAQVKHFGLEPKTYQGALEDFVATWGTREDLHKAGAPLPPVPGGPSVGSGS